MTPEQARWMYERMTPEMKERLADWLRRLPEMLAKVDVAFTNMGQTMADEAEAYANGER